MKKLPEVRNQQNDFVSKIVNQTKEYINALPKTDLEAVLLSGSLARGDYWPGEMGAMIDLTVMSKTDSDVTAEALFGPNEDPAIPYHCVKRGGEWYAVAFGKIIDGGSFRTLTEAKKFALFESVIVWENGEVYSVLLKSLRKTAKTEQETEKRNCLGYIGYLLSGYKTDRWRRREAYPQLHSNLNTAIQSALKCLYYINGKYAPAEDRRMYYSYDLEILPENYEALMESLFRQEIHSAEDYSRRERSFKNDFLPLLQS